MKRFRRGLIRWLESFDAYLMKDMRPPLTVTVSLRSLSGSPQHVFSGLNNTCRDRVESASVSLLVGAAGQRKEMYYLPSFTKTDQSEAFNHLEKLYNQTRITQSEMEKAADVIDNLISLL